MDELEKDLGRTKKNPCTNCFVVRIAAESEEELETSYRGVRIITRIIFNIKLVRHLAI